MRIKNGKLRLNIGGYLGGALCLLVAWAFLPPQRVPRQVSGIVMVAATLFGDYLVERIRARSARRAAATATTTQRAATPTAASSSTKSTAAKAAKNRGSLPHPTRRKAG